MESEPREIERGRPLDREVTVRGRRRKSSSSAGPPISASEALKRRNYFITTLHYALLDLQADVAVGRRFRGRKPPHGQNWTATPAGEQQASTTIHVGCEEIHQSATSDEALEDPFKTPEGYQFSSASSCDNENMSAAATSQRNNSGVSPSSSPRLPSPPPFTEVQFGPKSPSVGGGVSEFSLDSKADDGASRRIRPGTKAADMAKGPPFVPLHRLESAFQLQEYLKSLHAKITRDEASRTTKPIDKEMALELAIPPTAQDTGETVERNLWLYELCRFLCSQTTSLIVGFFNDSPPCSSQTCPEMRASEWQYLCAVHDPPKSCSAIDYCNHTLDWASNILSSNKHFPSRLSLGGEGGNAYQSMRQLTNIFRRVYRIYAHGWFQHREVFWAIEAQSGLYMFFKTVCDQYQLIPEDNYTIPPEAEGVHEEKQISTASTSPEQANKISILRKGNDQLEQPEEEEESTSTVSTGATTRRHRHTPSTGIPVPVIAEGHEDEEEETTMLDLGGPGPAQVSNSSLSPPKPRIERSKSPGLIEIPPNVNPDRAPEDPTPIAIHDSNPFGPPEPSELEDTSSGKKEVVAQEASSKPSQTVEPSNDKEQVTDAPLRPSIADDPDALSTVLGHMQDMDNPNALDSDTETQIAIEDSRRNDAHLEDDESMGEIDISQIQNQSKEDEPKQDQESTEVQANAVDKDQKVEAT